MSHHDRPCTSPRRQQCRRGTARPGRDQDPARWQCRGREMFQGPIMWSPIHEHVWYEAPCRFLRNMYPLSEPITVVLHPAQYARLEAELDFRKKTRQP